MQSRAAKLWLSNLNSTRTMPGGTIVRSQSAVGAVKDLRSEESVRWRN